MAERKVSTQKKADNAKAAKEAEEKRDEAAAEDASANESAEGESKIESAHDVLLDTGGPEGTTLEEAREEEAENDGKDSSEDDAPKKKLGENNADAAPFAGSNVAGSDSKTFGQRAQLYTDGLSGDADHNLGAAY